MTSMIESAEFQQTMRQIMEERIPFCRVIGLKLRSFDPDRPEMQFAMREDLIGNFAQGMLHGGVIAAALDSVAGFAVGLKLAHLHTRQDLMAQLQEFGRVSTIDLRIDFLQPGRGKSFIASADVTRLGKRVANVQMALHNDEGTRIATGSAAFMMQSSRGVK